MIGFVDYRISKEEINNLKMYVDELIKVPKCNLLYQAIDGHVDIQLFIPDKQKKHVIVHKDIDISFLNALKKMNISYTLSHSSLKVSYPEDIILNAFTNKSYIVHNLKYTDKSIIEASSSKLPINVKQGYTKCSILPINENAIITSDPSIRKTLLNYNFDILLVPPGDIALPGLNYGFIGGCGGLITTNKIAFFGSLNNYAYGKKIYKFLYKYDVEPIYLHNGRLKDRGSLLIL